MSSYYMFNKPSGCVTARSDARYKTVMDYFADEYRDNPMLHLVGRLDLDTEGLIFITDDGLWNQSLMNPESHVSKTYELIALRG
ncbi:MAG: hypothetical protein GX225_00575 [Clostridiales bacterium]|nr:hypothetical protein [Clostridiales bacterium]